MKRCRSCLPQRSRGAGVGRSARRTGTDPASGPAGRARLFYLDRTGCKRGVGAQRPLAVDFMRIYCGNPAMPASSLVACLDASAEFPGRCSRQALLLAPRALL